MTSLALAPIPTLKPARKPPQRAKMAKAAYDLKRLMELTMHRAEAEKCSNSAFTALARTYCLLAESLRVARGIPSPGQFRPDLDPHQLSRALKRARQRTTYDMPRAAIATPLETAPETPEGHKTSKESLSNGEG